VLQEQQQQQQQEQEEHEEQQEQEEQEEQQQQQEEEEQQQAQKCDQKMCDKMVTSCGMTTSHCALHLRASAKHMNNTNTHTTIHNPYDIAGVRSSTIIETCCNNLKAVKRIESRTKVRNFYSTHIKTMFQPPIYLLCPHAAT